jgi:hypothetical protein
MWGVISRLKFWPDLASREVLSRRETKAAEKIEAMREINARGNVDPKLCPYSTGTKIKERQWRLVRHGS